MLSSLPKLLDRNFAIAYLLPCVLFVLSGYQIIRRLSDLGWFQQFAASDVTTRATTFLAIAGILSVFLALANTFLIRRLEGYGWPYTWLPFLTTSQLCRYRDILYKIEDYDDYWDDFLAIGGLKLASARQERDALLRSLVVNFPDRESAILPTSIGNIIRAFEVYSRVTYGLDSIPGWPRLLRVVPDRYLQYVHNAKAKFDFCVNSIYLLLALLFVILMSLMTPRHIDWLIIWIAVDISLIVVLWHMAKQAAIGWGSIFKSAFDLYIDKLAEELGYSAPLNKEAWANIAQAFLYPDELPLKPRRSQFSKK